MIMRRFETKEGEMSTDETGPITPVKAAPRLIQCPPLIAVADRHLAWIATKITFYRRVMEAWQSACESSEVDGGEQFPGDDLVRVWC